MTVMNRYMPMLMTGLLIALLLTLVVQTTTTWEVREVTVFADMGARIREVWGPALPGIMFVFYWGVVVASALHGLQMVAASTRESLTSDDRWWMAMRGMVLVLAPIVALYLSVLDRKEWALWMPGEHDWLVFTCVALAVVLLVAVQDLTRWMTPVDEPDTAADTE